MFEKNGSSFDLCSISFSNTAMAFRTVSIIQIMKVFIDFSELNDENDMALLASRTSHSPSNKVTLASQDSEVSFVPLPWSWKSRQCGPENLATQTLHKAR